MANGGVKRLANMDQVSDAFKAADVLAKRLGRAP
jgi:hypothetical protein